MALSFEQRLAQFNGVVIPSPHPAGQEPSKPRKTRPTVAELDDIRTKTCPICGHAATRSREIRSHFVPCVKMNGNPSGARWHDNFNFAPRPRRQKRKHADMEESADADTANLTTLTHFVHVQPTAQHHHQQRNQQQRDKRQGRYYERLAAVNGVVIPSKLPPGVIPARQNHAIRGDHRFVCPICGSSHAQSYHVQSHFINCAKMNGNPMGARWDDACVFRGARGVKREVSTQQQDPQTQEPLQAPDYETDDLEFDDSATDHHFPLDGYQDRAHQSAALPSDGDHHQRECQSNRWPSVGPKEHCESDFDMSYPDLELRTTASSSSSFLSNYPRPYSSYTPMERMASEALLSMLQG